MVPFFSWMNLPQNFVHLIEILIVTKEHVSKTKVSDPLSLSLFVYSYKGIATMVVFHCPRKSFTEITWYSILFPFTKKNISLFTWLELVIFIEISLGCLCTKDMWWQFNFMNSILQFYEYTISSSLIHCLPGQVVKASTLRVGSGRFEFPPGVCSDVASWWASTILSWNYTFSLTPVVVRRIYPYSSVEIRNMKKACSVLTCYGKQSVRLVWYCQGINLNGVENLMKLEIRKYEIVFFISIL